MSPRPAFLFPGQGSQQPGMGHTLYEHHPAAQAVLDRAAELAGPAFLDTLFQGPAETLTDTRTAQPALLAVGVAAAEALRARGIQPAACAGHSLGEFTALVAAGSIPFEEAFRLVQTRARLMAELAPPGGMAAVLGLAPEAIPPALPAGVAVANYNGPSQTIIAGTHAGLDAAAETLKAAGAKRVLSLAVSGPFHAPLMQPAADAFAPHLEAAPIAAPEVPFLSSISGTPETDPARIRALLMQQITQPVQWTAVLVALGPVLALEAGPGTVLQGLAKRTPGGPTIHPGGTHEALTALD